MMPLMRQLPLNLEMRPVMGREYYLLGPSNHDAVAWIDRWPEWPAPAMFICGPAACGKSHLAAVWRDRANAIIVRPDALAHQSAEEIAEMGENLVIDGLDPWLGAREAETTLFHLYNIFKENKRSLLLTSRMNPTQSEFAIADLASRFRAAPVATIKPPDDILLGSVLIKLFSDRQINVSNDVIKYILPRMERSFVAARDIVENADKTALAQKRGISVSLLREVMSSMQQDDMFD
jgi:chromosomal replication initiation ATPase DnaA